MSFENHKWSENVPEGISEGLKFKHFVGACLQTPLEGTLLHAVLLLPKFSLSIISTPLSIFLNETLNAIYVSNVVSILHNILVINFLLILYKAIEKNILSVSTERQKELETLQEIITSLTLQVRERDQQIEELKQSLKGNWY